MLNKYLIYNKSFFFCFLFLTLGTHSSFHLISEAHLGQSESVETNAPYTPEDEILDDLLDNFISNKLKNRSCPGLAFAVIKNNQVVFQKTYGVKNTYTKEAIDDCSVFRIGSLSKGFAGVLASILAEKKLLDLDAPLSKYVPEITLSSSNKDEPITVRNILSHTTGYRVHTYSDLIDNNYKRENIYNKLGKLTPPNKTGSDFAYQNAIFGIIEAVIEKVTGLPYSEALRQHIFIPLDMNETSFSYEGIINTGNYCVGHKYNSKQKQVKPLAIGKHYYNMVSAGGVNAPLSDMVKWLKACMGHNQEVISNTVRRTAFTPNIITTRDNKYFNRWPTLLNSYYGLGWRNIETQQNYLIHHGGLVNGFRSEIAFDATKQVGVIFMFNSTCEFANECVHDFFEIWNTYNDLNGLNKLSGF